MKYIQALLYLAKYFGYKLIILWPDCNNLPIQNMGYVITLLDNNGSFNF